MSQNKTPAHIQVERILEEDVYAWYNSEIHNEPQVCWPDETIDKIIESVKKSTWEQVADLIDFDMEEVCFKSGCVKNRQEFVAALESSQKNGGQHV